MAPPAARPRPERMTATGNVQVRVLEATPLSPTLRRFVMERADGERFGAASPGAHARLALPAGGRTRRNAYSLTEIPADGRSLGIIVRRNPHSRGGSAHLHESVRPGDVLTMEPPQNLFAIAKQARSHLLLAGGIGVTPFLAYLPALAAAGIPARLHLLCRREEEAVFTALLAPHAARATIHAGPDRPDLGRLLRDQPLGTHVSICGPAAFMDDAARRALAGGFPPSKIHRESFATAAPGAPFVAVLARSRRRITVDEDLSLLEALEQAGLDPPSLCRGGVCGKCRVSVLSGTPEHRDHVLSPDERDQGAAIMTCVSRALSAELVLDV